MVPIILQSSVILFLIVVKTIFSPLLLEVEAEFGVNHVGGTSSFFFLSAGTGIALLLSGFVSAFWGHRRTIVLSMVIACGSLLWVILSPTFLLVRVGMFLMGVGEGLYLPSALVTLTSLVKSKDEAKVMSIHEIGTNLGFITAPLLGALLLPIMPWRGILVCIGIFGIVNLFTYVAWGRGGRFPGTKPAWKNILAVAKIPAFWLVALFMGVGFGGESGVLAILPAYLATEQGFPLSTANAMVGFSRAANLGVLFLAGYLADKVGIKRVMGAALFLAGIATLLLALPVRGIVVVGVFLQPVILCCFFPAGFAALSRVTPPELHSLAVSLILTLSITLGGGVVPLFYGYFGDIGSFTVGFIIYGCIIIGTAALVPFLRLIDRPEETEQ